MDQYIVDDQEYEDESCISCNESSEKNNTILKDEHELNNSLSPATQSQQSHQRSLVIPTVSKSLVAIKDNGEIVSEEDHKQRLADNILVNPDGTATCKVCGKVFGGQPNRAKSNAKTHVETHIEGLSYNCSQCDKIFRSKNALTCHIPCYRNK